jgi:hypothetical protein
MATRSKRKSTSKRSPAKRGVSRSRAPVKRKQTRGKSKSRSTRKNGRNARALAGSNKSRKTRRTPSRQPAARLRKAGKRSKRIAPRFSDAAQRPGETREQYTRRLEYLLRSEREVTRELTRTPTERARGHRFAASEDEGGGEDIPAGFQPVGSNTGTPIGDINELTVGLDNIDWDDFDVDWDDIYDDVGEEDGDLYGEDNG